MEMARPMPKRGLAAKTAIGDEREGLSWLWKHQDQLGFVLTEDSLKWVRGGEGC
jgi:hypothetical protein